MQEIKIESVKYLSCCRTLESEAFTFYKFLTSKIKHTGLRALTVAIAHDCLKHSLVIHELIKTIPAINANDMNQDFKKVYNELHTCTHQINKIEAINDEALPDFIKSIANLEDYFYQIYSTFIESELHEQFAFNASSFSAITSENLALIIENLEEDNQRHRDMLIQSLYYLNKKETPDKEITHPVVRYQNPDSWRPM